MCRLAAYMGPAIPLADIIIAPTHSLLEQSMHATEAKIAVQGDGFGFAWYDGDNGPGLYRDVLPAWSDGNLPSLCNMIRSNLFLAHVRASTAGETTRMNCHPFKHGRWSFMHNGQIADIARIRRALEALLPDELYDARRGTTDSELVFLLLLTYGLQDNPLIAVQKVISLLKEHSIYGRGLEAVKLTCVFSDGANLYAFRHSSDLNAPTLYARQNENGAQVIASEPLESDQGNWAEIPTDKLMVFSPKAKTVEALPIVVA